MTSPLRPGSSSDTHQMDDCQVVRDSQLPSSSSPQVCLPNALTNWGQIVERIGNRPVAVFLDYDGTLSHHVSDPEKAFISDEMKSVLEELSKLYRVSIITGRSMDTIRQFLKGMDNVFYAASHGLDITFDSTDSHRIVIAKDYVPYLKAAYDELKESIGHIDGCILENKELSLSVHYRNVKSDENQEKIHDAVKEVLSNYRSFIRVIDGEKVWDLRPTIDWDKGKAVEYILKEKFEDSSTISVYVGDDTTDEDAFKVVRDLQGVPILVNKKKKTTDRKSVV